MVEVVLPNRWRVRQGYEGWWERQPVVVLQVGCIDSGIFIGMTYETVDDTYVYYRDAKINEIPLKDDFLLKCQKMRQEVLKIIEDLQRRLKC